MNDGLRNLISKFLKNLFTLILVSFIYWTPRASVKPKFYVDYLVGFSDKKKKDYESIILIGSS